MNPKIFKNFAVIISFTMAMCCNFQTIWEDETVFSKTYASKDYTPIQIPIPKNRKEPVPRPPHHRPPPPMAPLPLPAPPPKPSPPKKSDETNREMLQPNCDITLIESNCSFRMG